MKFRYLFKQGIILQDSKKILIKERVHGCW
jgi:hypothetical protein